MKVLLAGLCALTGKEKCLPETSGIASLTQVLVGSIGSASSGAGVRDPVFSQDLTPWLKDFTIKLDPLNKEVQGNTLKLFGTECYNIGSVLTVEKEVPSVDGNGDSVSDGVGRMFQAKLGNVRMTCKGTLDLDGKLGPFEKKDSVPMIGSVPEGTVYLNLVLTPGDDGKLATVKVDKCVAELNMVLEVVNGEADHPLFKIFKNAWPQDRLNQALDKAVCNQIGEHAADLFQQLLASSGLLSR